MERAIGMDVHGHAACPTCRSMPTTMVPVFKNEMPGDPERPAPMPRPCPRCGRDTNTYLEVVYVDRIAGQQAHAR